MQPRPREILGLAACAAILLWQLFLPGFVGLADNRDFAKVAGRVCIGRVDELASYYVYFHADYDRDPRYCWDSGIPTSQLFLAQIASSVQRHVGDPRLFDIRWLGAIHAILFLAGWYTLLLALRPLHGLPWWIALAAALWIFLDVGIVSYLNTFYTDAAGIVGAMIMLPAALCLFSSDVSHAGMTLWFGLGALLFVTSKGQHAMMAPILIGVLWVSSRTLVLKIAVSAALIAGAAWVLLDAPTWYHAQSRFTLVFAKLLPASSTPSQDVAELGLEQSDLPLIGQHAFLPYSPAFNPAWLDAFAHRSSFRRILLFWLRHPWRTLGILHGDLANESWKRRPLEFSNFQPLAGYPEGAQTGRWGSWSALTTRLSRWWPTLVVFWYALALIFTPRSSAVRWIALLGIGEFLIASLADARETDRHLLLFHLFTDFTIFLMAVQLTKQDQTRITVDRLPLHHHSDR
jgi:hypothetical protein